MFVLLIVAVMLVFGLFLQDRISVFYHNRFKQTMASSFSTELTGQLENAAYAEDSLDELKKLLEIYSGRMGISSNRNYYILNKKNAQVLAGSDNVTTLIKSENILAAMAGERGDDVNIELPYIDYAVSVGENYIVYIIDKKNEMLEIMRTIYVIVGQALLIGILFSIILGLDRKSVV